MTRKRSNQWTAASAADPKRASWAEGFGGNSVYLDREHALVIVLRWSPDPGRVVTRALAVSAPP